MADRARIAPLAFLALLLALPPLLEAADQAFYISLLTRVLVSGLAAASLDLILGYGGMVSFGHAAFLGVGGYVFGILMSHGFMGDALVLGGVEIPGTNEALILLPIATILAGLVALAIGAICLRTGGVHFIMITLAFAQMLYFLFVGMEDYGGDDGLSLWDRATLAGWDVSSDMATFYLSLTALVAFLVLARRLVDSRFGMVIRAARQNERRLAALGLPVQRYKLACFALAGMAAGLAGALTVNHAEFVSPAMVHWTRSGEILVMVILGGMGTLYGPVLGAVVYFLLEHLLSGWTEHWMAAFGPALILAVLFFRGGLWRLIVGKEMDTAGGEARGEAVHHG
ncbi:MAG: branched-chain amino acid ABC transporter permease [Rhodospirillum sp.]|nr:branched-chain amino acid ABC transporter permease [Rhodospirillum sp.]MCF8488935.1 branched-chain amino acid ABC transporter permease [Rhodospirillum sp.]MCF8498991.1 branched-chain amino acid ABC transporter permease [Rhodospirillum sp.]